MPRWNIPNQSSVLSFYCVKRRKEQGWGGSCNRWRSALLLFSPALQLPRFTSHTPCIDHGLYTQLKKTKHHPSIMQPNIGIGVFVLNHEGKFILGGRKGSTGAGESLTSSGLDGFSFSRSPAHMRQENGLFQGVISNLARPSKPAPSANCSRKRA